MFYLACVVECHTLLRISILREIEEEYVRNLLVVCDACCVSSHGFVVELSFLMI